LKTDTITLETGDHWVSVAPSMGAVAGWRWRGQDIFRPTTEQALASRDPLGVACFAMAPWVSRVSDSRFAYGGRTVQLKPETDPRLGRFSIHGEVWRAPWSILSQSSTSVALRCAPGPQGAWPWAYDCDQTVSLGSDGLTMALTLISRADTPFPYTFGFHPYFARRPDSRLTASVKHRSILSPEGMPLGEDDAQTRWRDETITRGVQDHCYRGWDGVALISFPAAGFRVRMQAQDCGFLQVYAPDEEFFCVEPQTGGPNALNRGPDGGAQILAPGESATITVCFSPEAL
jgi:aldose 1-epimerase